MCGISGIWMYDRLRPVRRETVEAMTNTMTHRGPNGAGVVMRGRVGMGHRRLSILDLSNGAQPMTSDDERVCVSYNGEIYNFPTLRTELEASGHVFKTRCDTEVLIHGYLAWGEDLFRRLDGMFAFALHDKVHDRLYLVRDRLGIKPLYVTKSGLGITFASEIRALLASELVRPEVDRTKLDAFVSLGYVPGRQTLFRGIERVLPATFLRIADDTITEEQYWSLADVEPIDASYNQAQHQFTELFSQTLDAHLLSDVPLGAFLSGGVDSSAVVAFVRQELGRPLATFSIGYADDPESSELAFATRVAQQLGTDHHEFVLSHGSFFDGLDMLLEHSEEPIVEGAAVALFQLSKYAAQFATVFLSGEGSDEVFGGYDLYNRNLQLERLYRLAIPLRSKLLRAMLGGLCQSERQRKYLDWLGQRLEHRYRSIPSDVTPGIRQRIFALSSPAEDEQDSLFAKLFDEVHHRDALARMQYVDIKTWLVDDLLLKADKMTMAASVELRVPFLDHHVVEFGLSLNAACKLRDGLGKAFLKDLLTRYIPRDLVYRQKQGFPVPVSKWFREGLFDRVRNILTDPRCTERGYFRREYVTQCLERHRAGIEDHGRRLLSFLILELWHRKYID